MEANSIWEADKVATESLTTLAMASVETATLHEAIQGALAMRQPSPHTRSFSAVRLT